jgi:SAM-dependent methyltransferase
MPFSQSSQISAIVEFAEDLKPVSVLDLGTGMGQYGFLLRNNLENLNLFEITDNVGKQRNREDWRIKIDGVEGFAGYLTPVHDYAYNNIVIGDVLSVLPTIADKSYDLILGIDVLEHFTNEDGLIFLEHCKRIAKRAALVSTPKHFHAQDIPANPYENHRSLWSEGQLMSLGFKEVLSNEHSWVTVYRLPIGASE